MKVHGILGTHEEQKVLKSSNNCQMDFANHGVQLLRAKFANHKDKMAHLYKNLYHKQRQYKPMVFITK